VKAEQSYVTVAARAAVTTGDVSSLDEGGADLTRQGLNLSSRRQPRGKPSTRNGSPGGPFPKLPKEQRLCIQLRRQGLRYREIADLLGVSTSTAAEWLSSAVDRLRGDGDV
jgi:DNA-binding NarL/FixJ family response regulator